MATDCPDRQHLDRTVPFGRFLAARVEAAWSRLAHTDRLGPDAAASAVDALAGRLATVATPALHALFVEERGQSGRDGGYARFVAAATDSTLVADAFPVLPRLLDLVADQWCRGLDALLTDLASDHDRLCGPGPCPPVDRLRLGLGDPHDGGRAVAAVAVGGARWAYKPRSVTPEERFAEVARWLAARTGIDVPLLATVSAGGHGWVEWVRPAPCPDPTAYWRAAGLVTAAAHLTTAADLHNENVVATAIGPVLVDLECLDQPRLRPEADEATGPPSGLGLGDTVLGSGLLPGFYRDSIALPLELCGLLAHADQTGGTPSTTWVALGTDDIARRPALGQWGTRANRPRDADGRPVPTDVDAFSIGLRDALEAGTDPAFPARGWDEQPVRALVRTTMAYATALGGLRQPDRLASEAAFAEGTDSLSPLPDGFAAHLGPHLAVLEASERDALARLDVPRHWARGDDLLLDGGTVLPGAVAHSGGTLRRARLAALGPASIDAQVTLGRLSIEQHERIAVPDRTPAAPPAPAPSRATLTAAAVAILGGVLADRLGPEDAPHWLEFVPVNRLLVGSLGDRSLYQGSAGIAVALAVAASLTGDSSWSEQAVRCLLEATAEDGATWDSGRAGLGYAAMAVAAMVGDERLAATGSRGIVDALADPSSVGTAPDVIGGWAGVVAAGLAATQRGHCDAGVLAAPIAHLVAIVRAGLDDEVDRRRVLRAGFAHGVTGLAFVLARAAAVTGDTAAEALAGELIAAEADSVRARDGLPGRVARARGRARADERRFIPEPSWCWGIGGFVLAHTSPEMEGRSPVFASAVAASGADLASLGPGPSHLCCGEAGQLLALDALAARGDDRARDAADALAARLCAQALEGGPWRFYADRSVQPPSLMWGRAGIAYALARRARPDLVPDVLTIR